MDSPWLLTIAIITIVAQAFTIFLALFEPALPYKIKHGISYPLDSDDYLRLLSMLADASVWRNTKIEALTNGEVFYEAELQAIRGAQRSITLEAYIFQRGRVADQFVAALAERARAGVKVNLVLDAIGSFTTWNSYLKGLREAGAGVGWYHGFRWYSLPRMNHRTHREILVIDCRIGFVGGAGFADHWRYGSGRRPPWRDTMFRVEGEAVTGLQSTFLENWLESAGELLIEPEYFGSIQCEGQKPVLVVDSSPSSGESTRARMLYQTLMASARQSLDITTPYFLPDKGVRSELIRALERGVRVRIIAPGKNSDHVLTRRSSRRLYGSLLKAGAEVYEYQPTMIHTKSLVVDGLWSVVGSTNFDHRSFGINDEVNVATCDTVLAERLSQDFAQDLALSRLITYQDWLARPWLERLHEALGWVLERQQ
ncbi:MAG TPA: phospholipase D-like domain-containing protein [Bryobacteraceae bacterium]|jgi:cardiolipin synthase|nr:phospholipase D-like domain-containing protein [Bryobacteraceae bacterium]